MPTIPIPDALVTEWLRVAHTAISDPDAFHYRVGGHTYDDLMIRWLTATGVANPQAWTNPAAIKAVVARLVRGQQSNGILTPAITKQVLRDTIVDLRRGQGEQGDPVNHCWLIWVVLPYPVDQTTAQQIAGSGSLGDPRVLGPMRLSQVDAAVLQVASILDGPVDNTVGAPDITQQAGDWCLEYLFWGPADDVWGPFDHWLNWATLWSAMPPEWSVAFRYSLSMSAGTHTQMHTSSATAFPGHTPDIRADTAIVAWDSTFQHLWSFIDWGQNQLTRLPQEDQQRITVALELHRQLRLARSARLIVLFTVMLGEALAGSDRELARTVAQRLAWILASQQGADDRWNLFRQEQVLYDLRSRIAHGQLTERDIYQAYCHLAQKKQIVPLSANQLEFDLFHRNRQLLLHAVSIMRDIPLALWADHHLME